MKTLRILSAIAVFALTSLAIKAQEPRIVLANYHPETALASMHEPSPETLAEMEYMRSAYEMKMTELRLEHLMYVTERELRYTPPSSEVIEAVDSLNKLASEIEEQIKYTAPVSNPYTKDGYLIDAVVVTCKN
jgi:hypothetical protein